MEILELIRRLKRSFDGYITFRKAFLFITIFFGLMFYLGPSIMRWITSQKPLLSDPVTRCMNDHLYIYSHDAKEINANVQHSPIQANENPFLAFVGNGKIGIVLEPDNPLYIMGQRTLSLPVPFYPLVKVNLDGIEPKSATILHYSMGLVNRFECISKSRQCVEINYFYYAHRVIPSIFVQDIKVINPLDQDIFVEMMHTGATHWQGSSKSLFRGKNIHLDDFIIITGEIPVQETNNIIAIAIVHHKIPSTVEVKSQRSSSVRILTSVHYSDPVGKGYVNALKQNLVEKAKEDLIRALASNVMKLREDHVNVWMQLWSSGLSISFSKAANALNGDKINATIYYVLSHTRSPLHELDTTAPQKSQLNGLLSYPDRCYEGHHTLQASKLWSDLSTVDDINRVVSLWKLTLEKQGCYAMMQAGADGVLQAMLLSFGALRFSNHHLEFTIQPKDLHRDYLFRRISYGNATHLNISVVVGDDNKAIIYVVLDRSDKNYYACDGGCLDPPVQLSQESKQFPVKLTDPPTAVLYITADKQHMEELKHAIHVKEIIEAPAHEHHVIALHRHGHHLGGLPTMFWVSITFLVAVFHLFLFKLIYNEYCVSQDKFQARYSL